MNATEKHQRAAVVREAYTWLKTPYHHYAAVKGAGVDCAMILPEVYFDAGVIAEKPIIESYPADWMYHRGEERYLAWLEKFATTTLNPKAGDIAIWKFGRCFSHGAVIVDYPQIIHAFKKARMVILDDLNNVEMAGREVRFYTFWSKR